MNTHYQVIIKGLASGQSKEIVAGNLAQLFKVSSDEANQMLNEPNLVVKRGVDFQAAAKYAEALENCGCDCEVKPEATQLAEEVAINAPPAKSHLSDNAEKNDAQQEASPPIQQDIAALNQKQKSAPLTDKPTKSKLLIVGGAAMVAAVVAVAGYKVFAHKDSTEIKPQQPQPQVQAQAQSNAEQQDLVKEGEYSEKAQTVAGEVSVTSVGDQQALSLNGKAVYQQDLPFSIWKTFNLAGKTVLLLQNGGMGSSCPATYLFLTVKKDGQVSYTGDLGSCSDLAKVVVESDSVVLTIPDIRGGGDESWRYTNEAISQIKYVDQNIKNNADQISGEDGATVKVRGTLKRSADGKRWELKLSRTTLFPGCVFHNALTESLPIEAAATIPNVQAESEFEATLRCPEAGASISAINIPGSPSSAPPETAPSTSQVTPVAKSSVEIEACEYGKERCYEKSGAMVQACLNALSMVRGCL